MRIPVGTDSATTHPFDKVLKQVSFGGKGDIYAYLMSALQLEQVISGHREQSPQS